MPRQNLAKRRSNTTHIVLLSSFAADSRSKDLHQSTRLPTPNLQLQSFTISFPQIAGLGWRNTHSRLTMADKQPTLRQMFRRSRNKSPADDTTDSNSDGSCLMADYNKNNDRLSPALPVARPPSLSPNARIPRKLQKKRSNIDTSASLTSPASSWEQRDKSPAQEPTEREMNAPSRRDIRRTERRQPEPTSATRIRTKDMAGTSADPKPIPHKKESDSLSSCKTGKISKILGVNYSDQKSHLSAQLPEEDSSYESSDLESLGTLSPMSTKSEPAMSDKKFVDARERRKSIGPAVDTKRFCKLRQSPSMSSASGSLQGVDNHTPR